MSKELQANRIALQRLRGHYGVFLFTGGNLPRVPCDIVAIMLYLEHPFATEHISAAQVERYRHLVETVIQQGQAASPKPRTLPCRKQLTEAFSRLSDEMEIVGIAVESDVANVLHGVERESRRTERAPNS